jgi:hypothetical protein
MKKYFSFEVQVLDDKNVRRRFRASNYQVRTELVTCSLHIAHGAATLWQLDRAAGPAHLMVAGRGGVCLASNLRLARTTYRCKLLAAAA